MSTEEDTHRARGNGVGALLSMMCNKHTRKTQDRGEREKERRIFKRGETGLKGKIMS
jgi:hypothetical protein